MAAFNGDVGALDVLIRAEADVNAADLVSLIFIYINVYGKQKNLYYLLHVHVSIPTIIIRSVILYQHLTYASLTCTFM